MDLAPASVAMDHCSYLLHSVRRTREIRNRFSTGFPLEISKISVLISLNLFYLREFSVVSSCHVPSEFSTHFPYFPWNFQYWAIYFPCTSFPYMSYWVYFTDLHILLLQRTKRHEISHTSIYSYYRIHKDMRFSTPPYTFTTEDTKTWDFTQLHILLLQRTQRHEI